MSKIQRKRTNKRKNNSRKRPNNRSQPVFEFTSIKQNPEMQRSMRFSGVLTTPLAITSVGFKDLGQLLMTCVTGSTNGFTALASVRLQSVSCTLLPSIDEEGLFNFTWDGASGTGTVGNRTPSETRTFPYAPSNAARMTFHPPEDSLANYWIDQSNFAGNEILFSMSATSTLTVVLDLHFSMVMGYENNARTYAFVLAPTHSGIVCGRIGRNPQTSVGTYVFAPADLSAVDVVTIL